MGHPAKGRIHLTVNGATNAAGGNVTLSSQGGVTVSGLINTTGGARGTGVVGAGMAAGNITITGTNNSVTGAITASGGTALGAAQAGGSAGTVSITGAGTLSIDPGSKDKGGELGWSSPAAYVKPFGEALGKLKKGEYTKTPVKSDFGYHVIQRTK